MASACWVFVLDAVVNDCLTLSATIQTWLQGAKRWGLLLSPENHPVSTGKNANIFLNAYGQITMLTSLFLI
jgi:hypothetical protein